MVCYLPGILDWVVVANVEAEDFVESLWAFDIRSAHNLGYSTGWLEGCFFGSWCNEEENFDSDSCILIAENVLSGRFCLTGH